MFRLLFQYLFRSVKYGVFASIIICGSLVPAHSTDTVSVISVTGIGLGKGEFLEGFALTTKNLRLLAVCHIPAGWSLSVNSPAGPIGTIEFGAGGGVAELGPRDLTELDALFLVRTRPEATASITGTVDIETRGDHPGTAEKKLIPSNFIMETADQCPAPEARRTRHK